jgi:D-glycero-D-manno-heptose 1,7-bisphosphate phosphatase
LTPLRLRDIDTVFLDRDGTINVKQPEGQYVTSAAELILLPGAAKAVAELNASGLRTILVTNQSWLSRTPGGATSYAAIHARLIQLLAAEGARLDGAYHCPHARGSCDCRKPQPGMLRQAAEEHQIDLGRAVIIGDRASDLMAGRAAGTATILLRGDTGETGDASEKATALAHADAVADDLPAAVRLILRARGQAHDTAGQQAGDATG